MDTLQWRGRARIVAYVDLVLTSLGLLIVLLMTIGAGFLTAHLNNSGDNSRAYYLDHDDDSNSRDDQDAQAIMAMGAVGLWIFVAVVALLTFIQLYAAIKLLRGTDLVREFSDAWKNCATWRNITVVFLVLQIGGTLLSGRFISAAISFLIRGTFLYIVNQFMTELDQRRSPLEVPNMVTVMKN